MEQEVLLNDLSVPGITLANLPPDIIRSVLRHDRRVGRLRLVSCSFLLSILIILLFNYNYLANSDLQDLEQRYSDAFGRALGTSASADRQVGDYVLD